jgi:DNA-binding transcriptional LysR family regulator
MPLMHERMDLDWQDLRFFLAIQRAGSLTAAATRLRVNQSTVSRRLAALESAIGARLFERTPGGLRPTATADRIAPAAERLETEALGIGRVLSGAESRVEGVVRVTATEGLGVHLVAPALRELHRAHPGLQVELLLDSKSLSLTRREADVALRLARPRQAGLVARKLGEVRSALYASARYLEERGRPAPRDGLAGHAILAYDDSLGAVPESRWMAQHARRAVCALRTNSVLAQLRAAEAGLGLALLPCYLAEPAGLVRVLPRTADVRRELWLALHADLQHAPRIRAAVEFFAATAKARAAALQASHGSRRDAPDLGAGTRESPSLALTRSAWTSARSRTWRGRARSSSAPGRRR